MSLDLLAAEDPGARPWVGHLHGQTGVYQQATLTTLQVQGLAALFQCQEVCLPQAEAGGQAGKQLWPGTALPAACPPSFCMNESPCVAGEANEGPGPPDPSSSHLAT